MAKAAPAKDFDYGAHSDVQIGDNVLAQLSVSAMAARSLEKEIEEAEEALDKLRKRHRIMIEHDIPELMDAAGQTLITTKDGIVVQMDEIVRASIKEENRPKAHAWLNDNGHGNLIKRSFNIEFNKDEEAWAAKFQRDLEQRKKPVRVKRKDAVHSGTLTSFVKEMLAEGKEIPQELLGVFRQRVAKLAVK